MQQFDNLLSLSNSKSWLIKDAIAVKIPMSKMCKYSEIVYLNGGLHFIEPDGDIVPAIIVSTDEMAIALDTIINGLNGISDLYPPKKYAKQEDKELIYNVL